MSLPAPWVDRIFEKLALTYGREFTARWESCGASIADVKTDWAHELAGFEQCPEAIAFALANMPADRAPTVLQFRDVCRRAPAKALPRLPEPKADPERLKAELAKLAPLRANAATATHDHKAWAKRLISRHDAGERLNPTTLRFAREALGMLRTTGEVAHA